MDEQELPPAESSEARTGPTPDGPGLTDPDGIASASRSCLVILALGVVIILLICVSTAIRLIWG
jgi:hypothetical protein